MFPPLETALEFLECTFKGRVVCGTVYGEMHLKDLLGSFVRVGYRIPVPDFYLVFSNWILWRGVGLCLSPLPGYPVSCLTGQFRGLNYPRGCHVRISPHWGDDVIETDGFDADALGGFLSDIEDLRSEISCGRLSGVMPESHERILRRIIRRFGSFLTRTYSNRISNDANVCKTYEESSERVLNLNKMCA